MADAAKALDEINRLLAENLRLEGELKEMKADLAAAIEQRDVAMSQKYAAKVETSAAIKRGEKAEKDRDDFLRTERAMNKIIEHRNARVAELEAKLKKQEDQHAEAAKTVMDENLEVLARLDRVREALKSEKHAVQRIKEARAILDEKEKK